MLGFGDYLLLYIIALVILLMLDGIYIGVFSLNLYKRLYGKLMRSKPIVPAIVGLYAVAIVGYVYFVIVPAVENDKLSEAFGNGALFGFFLFSFYSLTNVGLIKGYSAKLAALDIVWGTFASSLIGGGTFVLYNLIV